MNPVRALMGGSSLLLFLNLTACHWFIGPKPGESMLDDAGGRKPEDFPELAVDVFKGMDRGAELDEDAIKGRNTWNLWSGGDEQFWDRVAREGFGWFDLLKTIDSRHRPERLQTMGLINQPGFKTPAHPDANGLWIDEGKEPDGIDPKVYGRPTGVMGFRLFDNPDFKGEAAEKWKKAIDPVTGEARTYYENADFAAAKDLVRPYRVGVACGACHIAFHPCFPPQNPAEPSYENLASAIGNQYIKEGAVFAPNVREGGFLYEMLAAQPRGTSDTSRIATDNINNPNAINPIFLLAERERIAVEEDLAGGTLALTEYTRPRQPVVHILKDGADSIGVPGAVLRVYVNIGLHHQQWLLRHNALIGLKPQQPFDIATARQESVYWLATQAKVPHLAAFFRKLKPFRLEDAVEKGEPVGKMLISHDAEVLKRGALAFADHCATCHSSKRPPDGAGEEEWFEQEVLKPEFRENNFYSNDQRYPVTKIKTNAARACATNAMAGHIWDNFSSKTDKNLPSVGKIQVWNPYTDAEQDFAVEGGGPGYYRTPSLISLWSSAPFFHNNSLGEQPDVPDPSVAGRMRLFDDAVEKLLWPEKRIGKESIWRTKRVCHIQLQASRLPKVMVEILRAGGSLERDSDGTEYLRIGNVPQGTPINLLANVDPLANPRDLAGLFIKLKGTLAKIAREHLGESAAKELMKAEIAPALFKVSKCPDFVEDRGHTFGSEMTDADKRALIEYLKTL